ncbi:hypothetical protein NKH92_05020 [Mesorhizobium sp. M0871]|uniref:hypothetical protein n=1 Tax=Mesorhizobium sp. M0871 TaxID=2957017 RepID=UPI00333A9F5D
MPMAVAWIASRTEDAVRDAWDVYRENCWDWHFKESRIEFEGPVTGGFFLEARSKASMHLLVLSESYDHVTGEVDADAKWMSAGAAEQALLTALSIPCFEATGVTGLEGIRVSIPPIEWIDLKCFSDVREDYYSAVGARRGATGRYDKVLVPRKGLILLWPASKPRTPLPQLVRPDGPGYMPLFCAAQWIATSGGKVDFDPCDTGRWQIAFQELLDRISSNEVRISGVRDGARQLIDGVVFAACQVDYPFSDAANELGWSEVYYLQSCPYLDEEHWRRGFDDSFRNRSDVRWRHLLVAKEDIARFWPFELTSPPKSGAAGRPSSMHLIQAEFGERAARGEVESTLKVQAQLLAEWLVKNYRENPPAGRKAIENRIRAAYNKARRA